MFETHSGVSLFFCLKVFLFMVSGSINLFSSKGGILIQSRKHCLMSKTHICVFLFFACMSFSS
jgi:hypothetical protein